MKLICNPSELADALSTVSKAISIKSSIPLLEGVKLSAEGTTLTLSATDLEMFIETRVRAEIKLEGDIVVNGKFLTEFVRKLAMLDNIELERMDERLIIRYGDNETECMLLNEDSYPEITQVDDDNYFEAKECEIKSLLDRTLFCAAVEDSRPILKGCLLEIKDGVLNAVAMDGFRMAVGKVSVSEVKGNVKIVVPGRALSEITKIMNGSEDVIKVNIQKNNVMFDLGNTRVTARLLEGEYINYEKVIPIVNSTAIVINKNDFEISLDRATIISKNKKSSYLRLTIENNGVTIKSNSEMGSIRETINCTLEGKDIEIAFNSRYLYDVLNKINEDYITVKFHNSNSPAIIKPIEGESFMYMILPIRLVG